MPEPKTSDQDSALDAAVRFPLWQKLALSSVAIAVLPIAVAGWLIFSENKAALRRASLDLQVGVAEDVARTLGDQVVRQDDVLRALAVALTDPTLSPEGRLAVATSLVAAHTDLVFATIHDAQGAVVDTVKKEGLPLPFEPTALTDQARAKAQVDGFAVAARASGQGAHLVSVVPLHAADDHVVGFVSSAVPLDPVRQRVARLVDETFDGDVDEVFAVDRQGQVLISRALPGSPVGSASDLQLLAGTDLAVVDKDISRAGPFTGRDGQPWFGGLVVRPRLGWAVVVQARRDKAYAPLYRTRNVVLATLAAAIVFALLLGLLLARWFAGPLERLAQMAAALGQRQFQARVEVDTADELSLLAGAMNHAALALDEGERRLVAETRVRQDISRFLAKELVDAVVAGEHDLNLGGVRKDVAILFADVVSFSPIAERLSPEDVVSLLNELFTVLTEIVFRHGGTVDKFIGDSVMALFGAAGAESRGAVDAVACAEEMLTWLEAGNVAWEEKYGVSIRLAVGVHCGPAVVGNIGSESRMEFTAIGSAVNLAARLEAVARPNQVLVTQAVVTDCAGAFDFLSLGPQALTGGKDVEVFVLQED